MTNINENRKVVIANLQKKAKETLELKQKHRQRRPIVIEFSGSPKSGKTTCINSLELFLKRNGFRVEVVQERASVCPVADKKSPMFNIWTACTSITGMISQLEQKVITCDVIILDRGVFDAFCWFEWLSTKKALSNSQKNIIDDFLSIDLIVNRVDIVFAEVTEQTLEILKNMLMERIGYISPSNEFYTRLTKQRVIHCEKESVDKLLGKLNFGLRSDVEENDSIIQPVPILVLTDTTRKMVLVVKKKKEAVSDDSPEKDKTLLYVGGHSRNEDCTEKTADDILAICRYTLQREVKEEIGISLSFDEIDLF